MDRVGVAAILAELRQELRRQGIRVRTLAKEIGVAEPTMGRWLRGKGLTIDGLDRICTILGIDIRDLIARSDEGDADRFTLSQERTLAADRKLAIIFFAILNGAQREVLEAEFGLPSCQVDQYLAHLQRLGLIDIARQGRVRPLTTRAVRWRPNGPLALDFDRSVKGLVLSASDRMDSLYASDMVRLSAAGRARVHALFETLRHDIHVIAEQDGDARYDQYDWTVLFMLLRPLDLGKIVRDLS